MTQDKKPREFWIHFRDGRVFNQDPKSAQFIHVIEHAHHTKLIEAKDAEIEKYRLMARGHAQDVYVQDLEIQRLEKALNDYDILLTKLIDKSDDQKIILMSSGIDELRNIAREALKEQG